MQSWARTVVREHAMNEALPFSHPILEGFAVETTLPDAELKKLFPKKSRSNRQIQWKIEKTDTQNLLLVLPLEQADGRGALSIAESWDLAYKIAKTSGVRDCDPSFGVYDNVGEPTTPAAQHYADAAAVYFPDRAAKRLPGEGWKEGDDDWPLQMLHAREAWAEELPQYEGYQSKAKGEGIVIGHPDVGYPAAHLPDDDLPAEQRLPGWNFMDGENKKEPIDLELQGHGLGTASVMLSSEGKGIITGVAPKAKIRPYRVTRSRFPHPAVLYSSGAIRLSRAIGRALQDECHVLSISLGWLKSTALHTSVKNAYNNNVIICAAAGNYTGPFITAPGSYAETITLGGCDYKRRGWKFSAFGDEIDASGPGTGVPRAIIEDGVAKTEPSQGTSFAVAMTAGTAALWLAFHNRDYLLEEYQGIPLTEAFRYMLHHHSDPAPSGFPWSLGHGIVNAQKLLAAKLPKKEKVEQWMRERKSAGVANRALAAAKPGSQSEQTTENRTRLRAARACHPIESAVTRSAHPTLLEELQNTDPKLEVELRFQIITDPELRLQLARAALRPDPQDLIGGEDAIPNAAETASADASGTGLIDRLLAKPELSDRLRAALRKRSPGSISLSQKLDVLRDATDFRDRIYAPTLQSLRNEILPDRKKIELLDQGREGACTGYALAAVIRHLSGANKAAALEVDPRNLYHLARRHDRWPGENYEGSSARGVMKGWYKHGGVYQKKRRVRPGAYYRVSPRVSDLQAALNEVSAVLVTAAVHDGWNEPNQSGLIEYKADAPSTGGHAFAVVGYTRAGFIIQNSWGASWGGLRTSAKAKAIAGLALWTYADYERNVWDAWVAQLEAFPGSENMPRTHSIAFYGSGPSRTEARPAQESIAREYLHIDDGDFHDAGNYPTDEEEAFETISDACGDSRPLLFFAHGGLNSVPAAAQRIPEWTRVLPEIRQIHFLWDTGILEEFKDVVMNKNDLSLKRAGGSLSQSWDTFLERFAHRAGHALWKEMKAGARQAFEQGRAGTRVLEFLKDGMADAKESPGLHLAGHSAGAIWMCRLLERWMALDGPPIDSLTLFAPACTWSLFGEAVIPALAENYLKKVTIFNLDERHERDDRVVIYGKSLLYLVSNSFEKSRRELSGPPRPLVGLDVFREQLPATSKIDYHLAPGPKSKAKHHGDFDDDETTLASLKRIVCGSD